MRPMVGILVSLLMLAPLTAQATAAGSKIPVKEERAGLLARAKVAPGVAEAHAQARFPHAREVAAEIEEEDGKLIYTFEFKTGGMTGTDEVNIDASSGRIVRVEHERPGAEAKERRADAKKATRSH